jgi:CheY-like chemotaxis protein
MIARAAPPVLVLEDSDEDFDTALEAAGGARLANRVFRAKTGDACLALLRGEAVEQIHPGLVLLDLNTPGMDGRDALIAIRTEPALRHLPLVVLSTSANPRDVARCYASGANAYHVKPVRYLDHLLLLRAVFSYWLTHAALAQGPGLVS